MSLHLLLPWFPIILSVGVGGRLLGRSRGLAMGVLCALFWIVLVQASGGLQVWGNYWSASAILIGAVAIALMGAWAGENHPDPNAFPKAPSAGAEGFDGTLALERISRITERFEEWIEAHKAESDLWFGFGEFIRESFFQTCAATHVKTYHVAGESALVPLGSQRTMDGEPCPAAPTELIEEVLSRGRSFAVSDGEFAHISAPGCSWCFAIRIEGANRGVVTVGSLDPEALSCRAFRLAMEHWVRHCWRTVEEASEKNAAIQSDPACGVLNRQAFLEQAQRVVRDAASHNEPLAVAVLAVQGLRELNDSGRWEVADDLLAEIGRILGGKARLEDRVGRFDGSRFVWLLRRVDSNLALLIVRQVVSTLALRVGDRSRWGAELAVRCGLVASSDGSRSIRELVSAALIQSHRARLEGMAIAATSSEKASAAVVETRT